MLIYNTHVPYNLNVEPFIYIQASIWLTISRQSVPEDWGESRMQACWYVPLGKDPKFVHSLHCILPAKQLENPCHMFQYRSNMIDDIHPHYPCNLHSSGTSQMHFYLADISDLALITFWNTLQVYKWFQYSRFTQKKKKTLLTVTQLSSKRRQLTFQRQMLAQCSVPMATTGQTPFLVHSCARGYITLQVHVCATFCPYRPRADPSMTQLSHLFCSERFLQTSKHWTRMLD